MTLSDVGVIVAIVGLLYEVYKDIKMGSEPSAATDGSRFCEI